MKRLFALIFALALATPAWAQLIGPPVAGTGATGPTGPTGPAGPAPTGNAPQIVGYSAANTVEAETLSGGGDCGTATLARAGANSYTLTTTCLSSNGNAFTSVAFGTALNLSVPPAIGGTTPAAGTFSNINQFNDAGTIASAGTLTCDLSLGPICGAQVGGGNFTIANPTNAVVKRQYQVYFYTVTGSVTATFGANWKIMDAGSGGGSAVAAAATFAVTTGAPAVINFHYDGTNFVIDWMADVDAHRGSIAAFKANTITVGTNVTIGSNSASALALTAGSVFSVTGGTAPTLTAGCNGAGSAVAAGSTDNRGKITTQTAASTTCTLTFNHTWPQAPFCVAGDAEATITPAAYSVGATGTGTVVFNFVSAANDVFDYVCM